MQQLPSHLRGQAADSLYFEAQCRIEDPVYGCVGIISVLHNQIQKAENQLARTQAEIAVYSSRANPLQLPQQQQFEANPIFINSSWTKLEQYGTGTSSFAAANFNYQSPYGFN